MTERRKENMIKGVVLPVIVAVVTGISSSYLTVHVTLAVLETRVAYVETDMISLKEMVENVHKNQTELAKRGEWMVYQDKRMSAVERAIELLTEQTKDMKALELKLQTHKH